MRDVLLSRDPAGNADAPYDGRVQQARDADALRQLAFEGCLDEVRPQERQRNHHIHMPLAAVLPWRDVVDARDPCLDLGEPEPPARDDELRPRLHPDRTRICQ
jgi:hypothetical protein